MIAEFTTSAASVSTGQRALIKFRHGLGSAVQLTALLKHLRHYHPDWHIDVAALVGKHSAVRGLCERVYLLDREPLVEDQYDRVLELDWAECPACQPGCPSTPAEQALVELFELQPVPELCRPEIHVGEQARQLARRYMQGICRVAADGTGRYPVVLIHYQGNAAGTSLEHDLARVLCEDILELGYTPVILDWDGRSPLPNGVSVFNPGVRCELWGQTGTGDAEALAALIELSSLMIGIASGPLQVAATTSTPTLGVWLRQHPIHHIGLADQVTHLVPQGHESLLRGDRDTGLRVFHQHYSFREYVDLGPSLRQAVRGQLEGANPGLMRFRGFWIRQDNAPQDLVVVEDIAESDSYRIDEIPMPELIVVDVGAHIGCFARRLHQRNPLARIICVECCPENIPALRRNTAGIATVVEAAVTYEQDVALLNAVYPGCVSTGGSTVLSRSALEQRLQSGQLATEPSATPCDYWADLRPIRTLTLEQILAEFHLDRINVLKLDCEGSEFSILENTTSLDRIGLILGEYHDRSRFQRLVQTRFATWHLQILKDGPLGTFWLRNPGFPN